ncbi:MAG: hypothetical protein JO302_02205, partial [Candidatus Eremiobacteraeota bacterium]|nr:hypothetical protein [Candidatus Eremiobacteraeota bacterium]
MRIVFSLVLLATVAACSSHGLSGVLPANPQAIGAAKGGAPVDLGRRRARDPVSVVLLLRYNRQAELNRFVDSLARSRSPHYLTASQFIARYAPTPQQQARVMQLLQRSGFRIEHTYRNRTLIDAVAPSAAVERLFSTEIHNFRQPRYGIRFANVRPLRVPAMLSTLVAAVDADTVVRNRLGVAAGASETGAPAVPAIVAPKGAPIAQPAQLPDATKNVVRNSYFKKGKLHPWTSCNSSATLPAAAITREHPYKGHFDAYAGTYQGHTEPNGTVSVCQLVTIPQNAQLTAWTWGLDNDRSHRAYQFAALFPQNGGNALTTVFTTRDADKKWVKRGPFDLSLLAGQSVYLAFGVVGHKAGKTKVIGQYL